MELENEVRKVKQNKVWRREYMTLAMIRKEEYKEGIEVGMEKGIEVGIEKGRKQEQKYGIVNCIELMLPFGHDEEDVIVKVAEKYALPADKIRNIWENR